MPEAFEACIRKGGRVRTVSGPSKRHGLGKGEYVKFCYINGKSYRGHVSKKKDNPGHGKLCKALEARKV